MEFTKEDLETFTDSGRSVCISSPDLLPLLKKYKACAFPEFSNRLYYFWLSGRRPIPLLVVIRIMEENNLRKLDVIFFSVGSGNRVSFLKNDFYMSYFLGLLLGDECLVHRKRGECKNMYHLQISFATEEDAKYGQLLTNYLFNIKSSIYFGRNCYNLCVYSKPLVMILNRIYQIPIGKKYLKLIVPEKIKISSKKSIVYFLKGVFDSDGNIYSYRNGESVQLRQKSKNFLDELRLLFISIGLDFHEPYQDIANGSWVLWSSKKVLVDNFIKKIIALKLHMPG